MSLICCFLSAKGQDGSRPEHAALPGGPHHPFVFLCGGLCALKPPAMQTAVRLCGIKQSACGCGFSFISSLLRLLLIAIFHLNDKHLVDPPDHEGDKPPFRVLHAFCRFQGIVQKISHNRSQIRACKIRMARDFRLRLKTDLPLRRGSRLASYEKIQGLIPCMPARRKLPDRPLQLLQIGEGLPVFPVDEKFPKRSHMVVEIVEQPGVDAVGTVQRPVLPAPK